MNTPWKQFAGWVTDLKHNPFETARLRLTGFYILVIAIILTVFSLFLFYSLSSNIKDNLETDIAANQVQQQKISDAVDHLQLNIFGIDLVVVLLTASLGYILAGKTLKPIKFALDAQTQFTADASHEFRTPLAIIKYNGDVVLKDPHLTITDAREAIQSSVEEAEHMSTIVERLLMLARNENGWNDLDMAEVDLKNIVENVAHKMSALARKKNLSLKITRLEAAKVKGDINTLNEMVLNILQNSVDYTPDGGGVTVELYQKDRHARLIIADSGIGIAAKDLPHIFERFYKSDQARTLKQGGGLGLSIVQDIVRKHNGTIEVKSEPGKGTRVLVSLLLI